MKRVPAHPPVVVGIGEILWDCFPTGPRLGGCPTNFVCHAQALGARAHLVGRVGDDPLGQKFFAEWTRRNHSTDYISVDPIHPTGTIQVTLDAQGNATFTAANDLACDYLPITAELSALAARADAIHFGTFAQCEPTARATIVHCLAATRPMCLRYLDLNLRTGRFSPEIIVQSLDLANLLKLNDTELATLCTLLDIHGTVPTQLATLIERYGLQLIALTRGERGSLLYAADGASCDHPGYPVTVVDTVGAGDAFSAALVVGLLRGDDLATVSEFANRVGSYVCTQSGATPELPKNLS